MILLRHEQWQLTPVLDEIINEALQLFQNKGNPSVHQDEKDDDPDHSEVDVPDQSVVGGNGTDHSEFGSGSSYVLCAIDPAMTNTEDNEDEENIKDSGAKSNVVCPDCPEATPVMLLTQKANDTRTETIMKRTVQDRDKFANTIDPNIDLFIEDFGAEKLLPLWK